MIRRILLVLACVLVGTIVAENSAQGQEIRWTNSPQAAVDAAYSSRRMIIVSVGASWCHYCKKMDKEVWKNAETAKIVSEGFVPLKLVDRDHKELIEALNVSGYPTTLVFSPDRQLLARFEGFVSSRELLRALRQIRTAAKTPATARR